ncbi:RNA polymerase sigma factor [Posidoniimonas polymericola]|nr:RNA polymerase sigma factor [Posidoniimonas polymericola]
MPERKSTPALPNAAPPRDAPGRERAEDVGSCYRRAYPRLVAIAAGVLGRVDGAEDVVQDAVEITIAKQKQFDSEPAVVRWLAGVVRHCALNVRRRRRTRRTYASDPTDLTTVADLSGDTHSPVHPRSGDLSPLQSAFDDHVLAALGELSEDARCCLLLRVVHQLSYSEISELTGLAEGTAMSHVHRGKRRLRELLSLATPQPEQTVPSRT